MEAIDVELSDFTLRRRSLLVSHARAAVARGLEPGEQVLLRDRVRGSWTARVADLGFESSDTVYRLDIGARLPTRGAHARVLADGEPADEHLTKQDLLDLLALLRATSPTLRDGRPSRDVRTGTASPAR